MQFLTIKRKISLLRKRLKQLSVKINYIIKMRTKTKTQPAVQHKALAAKKNKIINLLKYYNNKKIKTQAKWQKPKTETLSVTKLAAGTWCNVENACGAMRSRSRGCSNPRVIQND